MKTYTDEYGVERCDHCGDMLDDCACRCTACGEHVRECACSDGPHYPAVWAF